MLILSASDKAEYESALNDLHSSLAQAFFYLKERNLLTLSADGNFNNAYGNEQPSVTSTSVISSGMISGRIAWVPLVPHRLLNPYPDSNIALQERKTLAELKISLTDYEVIKDAKRIKLTDGNVYVVRSAPQPIGQFNLLYKRIALEMEI